MSEIERLAYEMNSELENADMDVEKEVIRNKYVAESACSYIESNYRCEAEVHNKLSGMSCDKGEFAILISPRFTDADDEYVRRFDRISFPSPIGECTLILEYHAAFGVCKFSYNNS